MAISCSKDENEVLTSNVETKIGDPEYTVFPASMMKLWWIKQIVINEDGQEEIIWKCIEHYNPQELLCGMGICPPVFGEDLISVVVDGATITMLHVNSGQISPELREVFLQYVERGIIELEEDCIITDHDILKQIETNHIPAGKYPIYKENDDFIILIKE